MSEPRPGGSITSDMPTLRHHHEGSWAVGRYLDSPWARPISLADAVALIKAVREAATPGARQGVEGLASSVPVPITGTSLRACPELPPTIEECIADNRAQTIADGVMYRRALAAAAIASMPSQRPSESH